MTARMMAMMTMMTMTTIMSRKTGTAMMSMKTTEMSMMVVMVPLSQEAEVYGQTSHQLQHQLQTSVTKIVKIRRKKFYKNIAVCIKVFESIRDK